MPISVATVSRLFRVAQKAYPGAAVTVAHTYSDSVTDEDVVQSFAAVRMESSFSPDYAIDGDASRNIFDIVVDWRVLLAEGKVTTRAPENGDFVDVRVGNESVERMVVKNPRWDATKTVLRFTAESQFEYDENTGVGS